MESVLNKKKRNTEIKLKDTNGIDVKPYTMIFFNTFV